MSPRAEIRFLLNDEEVRLDAVGATDTLLGFLRLDRRLTGTKEGCAEGDCGACTVLVGRLERGALRYEPVNACIRLLASLDGCHVVTVERLSAPGEALHPVQQAMVEHHGSQCGFCTPGFVMALYALWLDGGEPDDAGSRPRFRATSAAARATPPSSAPPAQAASLGDPAADPLETAREDVAARLAALRDGRRVEVARGRKPLHPARRRWTIWPPSWPRPTDATVVAGATDVGLWVTKDLRELSPAVFIGHLDGLRALEARDDVIEIGAGVSYSDSRAALAADYPHLAEFWDRIAGWQIRSMGTIGGNVANGSPNRRHAAGSDRARRDDHAAPRGGAAAVAGGGFLH